MFHGNADYRHWICFIWDRIYPWIWLVKFIVSLFYIETVFRLQTTFISSLLFAWNFQQDKYKQGRERERGREKGAVLKLEKTSKSTAKWMNRDMKFADFWIYRKSVDRIANAENA